MKKYFVLLLFFLHSQCVPDVVGVKYDIVKNDSKPLKMERSSWPLWDVVELGFLQDVKDKIENEGESVDTRNSSGSTILMLASERGHEDIVSYLVNKSADLTLVDNSRRVVTYYAATVNSRAIMSILVNNGAPITGEQSSYKYEPIYVAVDRCYNDVIDVLATALPPIVMTWCNRELFPLDVAVKKNCLSTVQMLVEKNASITYRYTSPLYNAVRYGHLEIFEYLLSQGADANILTNYDNYNSYSTYRTVGNLLHHAIYYKQVEIMVYLIQKLNMSIFIADSNGWTPIHIVAWRNLHSAFEFLISEGGIVNTIDNQGETPLMEIAIRDEYNMMSQRLMHYGALLNIRNNYGQTAILKAIQYANNYELVHILYHAGAMLTEYEELVHSISDNKYKTTDLIRPTLSCDRNRTERNFTSEVGDGIVPEKVDFKYKIEVSSYDPKIEIRFTHIMNLFHMTKYGALSSVEWYINNGYDVNSFDSNDVPLVSYAAQFGHIDVVRYLIKNGANVTLFDKRDRSTTYYAVLSHSSSMVELVIKAGAPVSIYLEHDCDYSPISQAVKQCQPDIVNLLLEYDPLLLDMYCDKYSQDYFLIHTAVLNDCMDVVILLLENGTDVDLKLNGKTPLYLAIENGNIEMTKLLISYGADVFIPSHYHYNQGGNMIFHSLYYKQYEMAMFLITEVHLNVSETNDNDKTLLHIAVKDKNIHIDWVKFLLQYLEHIDIIDQNGNTVLYEATYGGNIEVVKLLVENGANINAVNHDGNTPVYRAAYHSHYLVVDYLYHQGAIVEARILPRVKYNRTLFEILFEPALCRTFNLGDPKNLTTTGSVIDIATPCAYNNVLYSTESLIYQRDCRQYECLYSGQWKMTSRVHHYCTYCQLNDLLYSDGTIQYKFCKKYVCRNGLWQLVGEQNPNCNEYPNVPDLIATPCSYKGVLYTADSLIYKDDCKQYKCLESGQWELTGKKKLHCAYCNLNGTLYSEGVISYRDCLEYQCHGGYWEETLNTDPSCNVTETTDISTETTTLPLAITCLANSSSYVVGSSVYIDCSLWQCNDNGQWIDQNVEDPRCMSNNFCSFNGETYPEGTFRLFNCLKEECVSSVWVPTAETDPTCESEVTTPMVSVTCILNDEEYVVGSKIYNNCDEEICNSFGDWEKTGYQHPSCTSLDFCSIDGKTYTEGTFRLFNCLKEECVSAVWVPIEETDSTCVTGVTTPMVSVTCILNNEEYAVGSKIYNNCDEEICNSFGDWEKTGYQHPSCVSEYCLLDEKYYPTGIFYFENCTQFICEGSMNWIDTGATDPACDNNSSGVVLDKCCKANNNSYAQGTIIYESCMQYQCEATGDWEQTGAMHPTCTGMTTPHCKHEGKQYPKGCNIYRNCMEFRCFPPHWIPTWNKDPNCESGKPEKPMPPMPGNEKPCGNKCKSGSSRTNNIVINIS